MLDVREARYFVAVAEELHFGRAAERLHMSQPPLSQTIRELERRLGVTLLRRSTRAVSLTSAGEVLLQECQLLLNVAEGAEVAVRHAAEGQSGRIRIGAVTSAYFDPVPAILREFRKRFPRIEVLLHQIDSSMAPQLLRERSLDIALVRMLAAPPGMRRRTLFAEGFVLAVPVEWAPEGDEIADLAEWANQPWVGLPRLHSPDFHDQVVACCRAFGFAPEPKHTARNLASQVAMVDCGVGVALIPESVARQSSAEHVRFLSFPGSVAIELAAVWSEDQDTAAIGSFLATAEEVAENR